MGLAVLYSFFMESLNHTLSVEVSKNMKPRNIHCKRSVICLLAWHWSHGCQYRQQDSGKHSWQLSTLRTSVRTSENSRSVYHVTLRLQLQPICIWGKWHLQVRLWILRSRLCVVGGLHHFWTDPTPSILGSLSLWTGWVFFKLFGKTFSMQRQYWTKTKVKGKTKTRVNRRVGKLWSWKWLIQCFLHVENIWMSSKIKSARLEMDGFSHLLSAFFELLRVKELRLAVAKVFSVLHHVIAWVFPKTNLIHDIEAL